MNFSRPPTTTARSEQPLEEQLWVVRSYRRVDADTVRVVVDLAFNVFTEQSCRLYGIDAPEHDTEAGQAVIQVVDKWLRENEPLYVVFKNDDKFGGRFDGVLWDGTRSESLNAYLLKSELVREYAGGHKDEWLERELRDVRERAKKCLKGS